MAHERHPGWGTARPLLLAGTRDERLDAAGYGVSRQRDELHVHGRRRRPAGIHQRDSAARPRRLVRPHHEHHPECVPARRGGDQHRFFPVRRIRPRLPSPASSAPAPATTPMGTDSPTPTKCWSRGRTRRTPIQMETESTTGSILPLPLRMSPSPGHAGREILHGLRFARTCGIHTTISSMSRPDWC